MRTDSVIDPAPPRGMRDFYPEQTAVREFLFDAWTRAARAHGFVRYDACIVENLGLLTRKAGEEIVGQIYAFRDKSDRELALRPEITPSLARMVSARWNELSLPLKWFAIGQCFRYERASRGRKREHYQWNLDIIGADGVRPEVEVLATALTAVADLGLASALRIHISNRALLADLLAHAGIPPERHPALFLVLDKRGKLSDTELTALLVTNGFSTDATKRIFELFQIDSLAAARQTLEQTTPALQHTEELFSGLAEYGWRDQVCFDLSIVRGLNYYTGTVFEAFDHQRRFRAVFGGGRYDDLLRHIGGRPAPAVGLGFGDVVITEIMQELACLPPAAPAAEIAVGYMENSQAATALRAVRTLRRRGHSVDFALQPEKARAFFARVGRAKAQQAIYIGPDDLLAGSLRIKDLDTRTETALPLSDLLGGEES